MSPKFCKNCGASVKSNAKSCTECDVVFDASAAAAVVGIAPTDEELPTSADDEEMAKEEEQKDYVVQVQGGIIYYGRDADGKLDSGREFSTEELIPDEGEPLSDEDLRKDKRRKTIDLHTILAVQEIQEADNNPIHVPGSNGAEIQEPRSISIFICYADPDLEKALQLNDCLDRVPEFEPWINKKKMLIGANWRYEIERAIEESDFFAVCVSSNLVNRIGDSQREIKLAKIKSLTMPEGWIYIMPIRLDASEVPKSLSDYHYNEELFNPGDCKALVQSIKKEHKRREESQNSEHSRSQQDS